jgi:hypothetical protein
VEALSVVKRSGSEFDIRGTSLRQADQHQACALGRRAGATGAKAQLSHLVTESKNRSVIISGCGCMLLRRMVSPALQIKKDDRFDPF